MSSSNSQDCFAPACSGAALAAAAWFCLSLGPVGAADDIDDSAATRHAAATGFRSIDGSANNRRRPALNAAGTPLSRHMRSDYADGVSQMASPWRQGSRQISNAVVAQQAAIANSHRASDYLWQWGQFIDHDLDLTEGASPAEPADIVVPAGDPFFDPTGGGNMVMAFNRSLYDHDSGTGPDRPRQQINQISGWIYASQVYGSEEGRAAALRTMDGTGRLKTSAGDLLPFNTEGLPNGGGTGAQLFLAGDVRVNEQVALTAMHTLFVREHNRLATQIGRRNPSLSDEQIYQRARHLVAAEMQVITYREFLPALLGPRALRPYRGYRPSADSRIMNEFSTAAFRLGHSLLSPELLRLDKQRQSTSDGPLPLRDAFFAPQIIVADGIDPLLRGLAWQVCQQLDVFVIDDVRNFLFGQPGQGGFDLASLNIQRGRDHGLPGYNEARRAMKLAPADRFADVSTNVEVRRRLASVYVTTDDIDLWVGGLAEDPVGGALVGELLFEILTKQFEALRDGDRFWYQRSLAPKEPARLERTSLADIIRRNTDIGREIPDDVFHVPRRGAIEAAPSGQ